MLQRTRDLLNTSTAEFKKVPSVANGGNGSTPASVTLVARGLNRRKWNDQQRLDHAVGACLGEVTLSHLATPQSAFMFGVLPGHIERGLKARKNGNGNGANYATEMSEDVKDAEGNTLAAVETTVLVTETMPDTPAVRNALRRRAAQLGCRIEQINVEDDSYDGYQNYGPYALLDETGHLIWLGGLPLVGIADALACLAHEHQLPLEEAGNAWKDFGKSWLRSS